ncbi:RNA polymerase II transcriptional coactivator [Phlebotomus papatasi]|uniref:Transcriptional coactivator p15 (PC4) C-terminal domain-containing protein n=1 Tax=Phlebotomus papatasi TaxID=29031 RepID=A0A1B0D2B4_PHLPP|nr:RNA polymerase II transcriptional coactivator [Phlebotomus papatasi]
MPKNKKEASSSDSDSGPEDRTPAPKKTKTDEKKQSSSSGNDSNVEWHLDGKRYVKINEFRGRQMVDIREYYEKDGELLPGKKGISLTPLQWKKLLGLGDEINKQLN